MIPATKDVSDAELFERFPDVMLDHDNKYFYRGLLRHEYLVNRCADCQLWHRPMRSVCPECWSSSVVPTPISGLGKIYTFTVLYQGSPAPGVDYSHGHPLAVVELVEQRGLGIPGTIVGCNREEISVGLPVQLTWTTNENGPSYAFAPVASSQEV